MVAQRVGEVLRGISWLPRQRPEIIPVSRVPGVELIRLGGGDTLPTPGVPDLPTGDADRSRGLCGASLALPPANVRLLKGVEICVGENLVRTSDGAVVVNNAMSRRLANAHRRPNATAVQRHAGSAALYGSAAAGTFEILVESVPPVLLLQHPALRSRGPVEVFFGGTTTLVERFLLDQVANSQVRFAEVEDGTTVQADVTLFPAPVGREGAGALSAWYRRWLDQRVRAITAAPVARRLVLTHGPGDVLHRSAGLLDEAVAAGFTHLDTSSGELAGGPAVDVPTMLATLRDATEVLGASDDALGHCLVSRRAEMTQIGCSPTITPRVAQLAASRALPYTFVRPDTFIARMRNGDTP